MRVRRYLVLCRSLMLGTVAGLTSEEQEHRLISQVMNHSMVIKKAQPGDLISLNFSDRVFHQARWDDVTVLARGLFVDRGPNGYYRVCGRSYRKFFYENESRVGFMATERLVGMLHFPLKVFLKANGFLGILFARRDPATGAAKLVPSSKSTTEGPFAGYFHEILTETLQRGNVSAVRQDRLLACCSCPL